MCSEIQLQKEGFICPRHAFVETLLLAGLIPAEEFKSISSKRLYSKAFSRQVEDLNFPMLFGLSGLLQIFSY